MNTSIIDKLNVSASEIVYLLRTCDKDLKSHGGFQWPSSGLVSAPDWDPTPECGKGLHGLLSGEGNGSLLNTQDADAKWMVIAAVKSEVVQIDRKVKVPRAYVVFVGSKKDATDMIVKLCPGSACVFATVTSGESGHSTSGDFGHSISGYSGHSISGEYGHSISGEYGHSISGYGGHSTSGNDGHSISRDYGHSTSGESGHSTSGESGHSISGDYGSSTSGHYGHSTSGESGHSASGYYGHSTSGENGIVQFDYLENGRKRIKILYVGEDNIKAWHIYFLNYKCEVEDKGHGPSLMIEAAMKFLSS